MVILETPQLQLREFEIGDAAFLLELFNTPNWLKYIGDRNVNTLTEAESYLKSGSLKSYTENGFGFYLVIEKTTLQPIGMCGFKKRAELNDVDMGFAFLPEYIGKGFGYEIAKATLRFGFEILELKKIIAIVDPENTPSNGLIKKLGFEFEKMIQFGENKKKVNLYGMQS